MPLYAVVLALSIHTLWGGNAVAVKWSLELFPPLWSGLVRFAIGTACIGLWAIFNNKSLRPQPSEWPGLIIVSVLFTVQIWTMNLGFSGTSGSLGSLLISLNPLFAAVLARFFVSSETLTLKRTLGLLVAIAGTAVILSPQTADGLTEFARVGNWIMLGSAVLLGARLMHSAKLVRQYGETRVIFWMMLLSLPMFALGGATFETINWQGMGWRPIVGVLYQGVVIAGFAFMVNSFLMRRYSPSVVVSFNFVSPISGVALSVWLLNESVSPALLAGMVLVAAGLTLITRK